MQGKLKLKNALKIILCKHDYEQEYLYMIDGGMDKLYKLTCKKCGKEKNVRGGLLYKYFRSERQ